MANQKTCGVVIEKGERHVQVTYFDGDYIFEWAKREAPGNAYTTTKVRISSDAADSTLMALVNVMEQVHVESERAEAIAAAADAASQAGELEDLRRDAERYRTWRDAACYRTIEAAKALCMCITPAQIDDAIDRLS